MRNSGEVEIFAGVRDVQKFKQHRLGIPTVHTDMSRRMELTKNLKGFERAFLVVPSDRNRTGLASIALDACKAAGVKFVLLLSVTIANTDTIFGRQFQPIEDRAKSLGIHFTILRAPMFMDNIFAHVDTIKKENRICDPRNPRVQFASLSLHDLARCAADILLDPLPHYGKTYNLVSQKFSMIDLSQSMSSILKRDVKVREISWNHFREALVASQIPEWQIDGLVEWLDSNHDRRLHHGDLENIFEISGEKPSTLNFFLAVNAPQFGWAL
jgi:uncharacterized protein YbjT (DUF2867 family)